jgi:uncharacterized membrane protein
VASDRYDDPDLGSLRSPVHDVTALAAVLADPRIGGFEVDQVFNRQAHEVNAAIEDFFCDKQPDDVLLLYVSCHGVKDDGGRLYFATSNTRVRRLGSTGIASSFVSEQMTNSMSRNIVLLLDCCYSGAFVEGMVVRGGGSVGINERLSGSGRAILSSSSALEYSFELDRQRVTKEITQVGAESRGGDGPSVFTEALVRGLTTGRADRNRDGRISIDELYDYTFTEVTAVNPNQTPTKFSDVSGELIVAYSPGTVRPAQLPDEVSSAIEHPLARVRAASVSTLRDLALKGDDVGRLAYGRLKAMLNDDSRMVTSTAQAAIVEIERARAFPRVDGAPFHGAMGHPQPVETWTPPTMPASVDSSPPPLPWQPSTPPPVSVTGDGHGEPLHGRSVLAYFMPFFTSLLLLFSRSREIRFHAVQCALIDLLTMVYIVAGMIPMMIYSSIRYGSDEIPSDDVPFNVFMVSFMVLPLVLRIYCLVELARKGTVRVKFLGALANRVAGRPPAGGRSAQSIGGPWRG